MVSGGVTSCQAPALQKEAEGVGWGWREGRVHLGRFDSPCVSYLRVTHWLASLVERGWERRCTRQDQEISDKAGPTFSSSISQASSPSTWFLPVKRGSYDACPTGLFEDEIR